MNVVVAATQMACGWDRTENIRTAERLVREAKGKGAQIILLQELFETPYFCKDHLASHLELARPAAGNAPNGAGPALVSRAASWVISWSIGPES